MTIVGQPSACSSNMRARESRVSCFFVRQVSNVGQVSVPFGKVQSIADHEVVFDGETRVVDGQLALLITRFVEQGTHLY